MKLLVIVTIVFILINTSESIRFFEQLFGRKTTDKTGPTRGVVEESYQPPADPVDVYYKLVGSDSGGYVEEAHRKRREKRATGASAQQQGAQIRQGRRQRNKNDAIVRRSMSVDDLSSDGANIYGGPPVIPLAITNRNPRSTQSRKPLPELPNESILADQSQSEESQSEESSSNSDESPLYSQLAPRDPNVRVRRRRRVVQPSPNALYASIDHMLGAANSGDQAISEESESGSDDEPPPLLPRGVRRNSK